MKILLTGSLGHISLPLTKELIRQGYDVTVISSNPERRKAIETLGAKAAIGQLPDADFLVKTFTGAESVYCMTPMPNLFDPNVDVTAYYTGFAPVYLQAIRQSGVQRVVHLSSVGAHTNQGSGMLRYAYEIENVLQQLSRRSFRDIYAACRLLLQLTRLYTRDKGTGFLSHPTMEAMTKSPGYPQ